MPTAVICLPAWVNASHFANIGFILQLGPGLLRLAVTVAVGVTMRAYTLILWDTARRFHGLPGGGAKKTMLASIVNKVVNIDPGQEAAITPATHLCDLSTSVGVPADRMHSRILGIDYESATIIQDHHRLVIGSIDRILISRYHLATLSVFLPLLTYLLLYIIYACRLGVSTTKLAFSQNISQSDHKVSVYKGLRMKQFSPKTKDFCVSFGASSDLLP
jgi:hypothetical protein